MQKKRIIGAIALITTIGALSFFYYCKNAYKNNETKNNRTVAVYVEGDIDGEYVSYNSKKFPTDGYVLNTEKSYCVNGSVLSQDATTKSISVSVSRSDQCKLYFDKEPSASEITLQYLGLTAKSGSPDFSKASPAPIYTDNNFSGDEKSYSVTSSYYYTYADEYTFDESTGYYTLVNPSVGKYSDIYSTLSGKYLVSYRGSSSSEMATYSKLSTIYQVQSSTTSDTLYYKSSTNSITGYDESETGVWKMEDDYGTSYYFRGNVTNNYVKFGKWSDDADVYYGYKSSTSIFYEVYSSLSECENASSYNYNCTLIQSNAGKDMYWRIIRINGDGTVRMIYDGTSAYANGTSDTGRLVNTSVESDSEYDDNAYVGYMYGLYRASTDENRCLILYSSRTVYNEVSTYATQEACEKDGGKWTTTAYEATHANVKSSNIKSEIDSWYETNIEETGYSQYVADEIFCNDRSITSGNGYSTDITYYSARDRLKTNKMPSLKCSQKNDAFTVDDKEKGNGDLTYPVGLITADEISLAGGVYNVSNIGYYLYKGSAYWSFSPSNFGISDDYAYVFRVKDNGAIASSPLEIGSTGAAPVINLSAETVNSLIGTGVIGDEYRLAPDSN